jgi:glutathione S-transferase
MNDTIGFDDLRIEYLSIAEARKRSGLRLVLGAYTVPGPWREACKGLFDVKGLTYTSVRTSNPGASDLDFGANGTQSELYEWTAQSSAPVAIWNDERPRSSWIDQLNLAERLAPEPRLVPVEIADRTQMFGLINEIAGENGFGWNKRLVLIHEALQAMSPQDEGYAFWNTLGEKYLYTPARGLAAKAQIIQILNLLGAQLVAQQQRGRRYLLGERLSALDIYFSTFYALIEPLPPALCPMASSYRPAYTNQDKDIAAAVTPALAAHRDFIYAEHLVLPVVF